MFTNALNVNEMDSKLKRLRLVQAAMIAAIPMYGWITESVCGSGSSDWTLWHWVMMCLALYAALVGFFFRRRLMHRSEEALARDASNPKGLKQWESGHLIGLASAEAIVGYGVVVRMVLGSAVWQASLFYAFGFVLLVLWTPRMPTNLR